MPEKALDILKIFVEKYIIPSIISAAVAIAVFSITTDDFWLLNKLGKWLYMGLIFLVTMMAALFISFVWKRVKANTYSSEQDREYRDDRARENEKLLLDLVDSLRDDERRKLFYFVNNGNEPLVMAGRFASPDDFLERYCSVNEYVVDETGAIPVDFFTLKKDGKALKKGDMATRFKLKDELYDGLVWLKNRRGSISRF